MGYKLLVVDDEPIIRRGIRELVDLVQLNITEFQEAADGSEALKLLDHYKADIILADINMPNLDGLSFAKEVKRILPNTRIVIITGYDYFEYAREALRIHVDDYILKPVTRNEISQILKNLTDKLDRINKEEILQQAVSELTRYPNEQPDDNSTYMEKIIFNMEENCQNPDFDLMNLASMMNLSSGYLSRLFKNLFQKTFSEYLYDLRLERARLLLIGTNMKIYEITEKCGYSDPNYFSISFKKKFGCPPNKYREMIGKG